MKMNSRCIVCESTSFVPFLSKGLIKCSTCSFVTTDLSFSEEELKKIYSQNYFFGEEYENYLADRSTLEINFKRRLQRIASRRESSEEPFQEVHEIGCAYGFFGNLLKSNYPNSRYQGFDINTEAVAYAEEHFGLNCSNANYTEVKQKGITDVFMWDVIEHLEDPEKYLKAAHSCMEKGGELHITTGDIERFLPKFQKAKWRMIHPPTHLHYFSRNTLTKLLNKEGFDIVDYHYPGVTRSVRQIVYSLFLLKKKETKMKRWFYQRIPRSWYITTNTFDILFITARKR